MNQEGKDKNRQREIVSGRVSAEAAAGWRNFCQDNGISLAAFLEAAGLALAEETFPPTVEERKKMVDTARRVDLERRSRKK
ncbi:MAG: hypothetical protein DWQ01_16425 [Planctomycetota bacterium]|nr:MAG: hypothetical protein DWQ01_16425 [Planctomycetota bacterium]